MAAYQNVSAPEFWPLFLLLCLDPGSGRSYLVDISTNHVPPYAVSSSSLFIYLFEFQNFSLVLLLQMPTIYALV
jgi:hypothetical protein